MYKRNGGEKVVIGKNIKFLLYDRDMLQSELAAKAKVSEGMISRIVREGKLPSVVTLDNIAKALGTTIDDLLHKELWRR